MKKSRLVYVVLVLIIVSAFVAGIKVSYLFTGKIIAEKVDVVKNSNAPIGINIKNTNDGTKVQSEFRVDNGVAGGDFWISGTNYTDGSNFDSNEVGLVSETGAKGIHIRTNANNQYIRFSTHNGTTLAERGRIEDDYFKWRSSIWAGKDHDNNHIKLYNEDYTILIGDISSDGNNLYLQVFENKDIVLKNNAGDAFMLNGTTGAITISNLAGSGNAYLCIDSKGKLYRSSSPCI